MKTRAEFITEAALQLAVANRRSGNALDPKGCVREAHLLANALEGDDDVPWFEDTKQAAIEAASRRLQDAH